MMCWSLGLVCATIGASCKASAIPDSAVALSTLPIAASLAPNATDGGAPRDEKGNATDWIMGPGRVLTNALNMRRISGATNLSAYGEHYERMLNAARMALGASDAAIGKVDSATAESGIALALQLAPMVAHTKPKDQHIIDVHAQMFYDLCFWLAGIGRAHVWTPVT